MKKNLYKLLLLSIFLIIVATVMYFRNVVKPEQVREFYNEEASASRAVRNEVRLEKKFIALEKESSAQENQVYNQKVDNFVQSLNQMEQKVLLRSKYCLQKLNEVITDDKYIDIDDPMYSNHKVILDKFTILFQDVLPRDEADKLYASIYYAVEDNIDIDPKLLFSRLERIDICREARALNFIDTVFEAYRIKRWPGELGRNLMGRSFDLLNYSLSENQSVENLLYFTSMLLVMTDNKLIPPTYLTELEELSRRINENHSIFKEVFAGSQGREENYILLSDYLRRNRELGTELRQVTSDIKNVLGIEY